jgi:hypothetical protein
MEPLTVESLRAGASAQGLQLSDEELSELMPLVQSARALMDALPAEALRDVEPASQYRML